jgi:hypothetical protein
LALVTLGCGDSNNDFVFTGTNPNPNPQTGTLTFNFLAPAAQAVQAPNGTTDIRFDLFDGQNGAGALIDTVTVDFQTTVVLTDVPLSVRSVLITFITANGIPVQTLLGNVTVPPGGNATVDLTAFTVGVPAFEELSVSPAAISLNQGATQALTVIASFDNGFDVNLSGAGKGVVYTVDDSDHATVSSAGVVTGTNPGTAVVTVEFSANGTTISVDIPVTVTSTADGTFEITPPAVTEAIGQTTTNPLVATFTPTGGTASNVIAEVVFESSNPTVATVNPDGTISIGAGAQNGDTATLTGTYTDEDDNQFTDIVVVTVAPDVVASISVSPTSVTLPTGGFRYDLVVTGLDANGDPIELDLSEFNSLSSNSAAASVDGTRVTTGVAGAATITVRYNADPSISASAAVTTVNATIDEVLISEDEFDMYISQGIPLQATAELSTGQVIPNAQNSPDFDVLVGSDFATVVGGELRALEITSAFPFTSTAISFGFITGGDTAAGTLTVREVQLTGVQVRIGGITDDENDFLIPQGRPALFEAIGTFEDGSSRPLQVGEEYEIVLGGAGGVTTVEPGTVNPYLDSPAGTPGETKTYTVDLLEDIAGALADPTGDMTLIDGTPTALTVDFANYPDDHRLLTPDESDKFDRVVNARANFAGLTGFRISGFDILNLTDSGTINVNGPDTSIDGWPTIACDNVGSDDIVFGYASTSATLEDITVLIPDVVTTRPQGEGSFNTLFVAVGDRLTFRTVVDYGDGQGLVDRSLDYPVFESTFDFVRDVWGTADFTSGATTYFFKISSLDHNPQGFTFQTLDAEGDALPPVGIGSFTAIAVDAVRNL